MIDIIFELFCYSMLGLIVLELLELVGDIQESNEWEARVKRRCAQIVNDCITEIRIERARVKTLNELAQWFTINNPTDEEVQFQIYDLV